MMGKIAPLCQTKYPGRVLCKYSQIRQKEEAL